MLQPFVQDRGKIMPRRMTGTCSKHQRWLGVAIKRARNIALLPFAHRTINDRQDQLKRRPANLKRKAPCKSFCKKNIEKAGRARRSGRPSPKATRAITCCREAGDWKRPPAI
jgi:hypothetical protein